MKPLRRGKVTPLIEIPASWYLDDLPPMMFIKASPNTHGFVNPRQLEQLWIDQFDWVYREYDYAVVRHDDSSGRQRQARRCCSCTSGSSSTSTSTPGVRWATFDEIANDFAKRNPRPGAAVKKPRDARGKG